MSTTTPVRPDLGSGLRLARAEVVIIRRLLTEMWKITRWFWPIGALIAVIVGIAVSSVTPITQSIWENAGQWPRWWLFAMAISLVATHLPVVILHGVTRRAAIRAVLVSVVLISMAWAAFMVCGHVVERFVYGRLGWPDVMETPHLFRDGYDVLPMFAEYTLIFLAYLLSGALISGCYYRYGWFRGTLLLPGGLLPAVAIEGLLSTGWYGAGLQQGLSVSRPSAPLLVVASIAVLSLTGLALYLMLRDVPIGNKK